MREVNTTLGGCCVAPLSVENARADNHRGRCRGQRGPPAPQRDGRTVHVLGSIARERFGVPALRAFECTVQLRAIVRSAPPQSASGRRAHSRLEGAERAVPRAVPPSFRVRAVVRTARTRECDARQPMCPGDERGGVVRGWGCVGGVVAGQQRPVRHIASDSKL